MLIESLALQPSLQNGFYKPGGLWLPRYGSLWRGCVAAYSAMLGRQGGTLYDWSGYGNYGTLTNMDPSTDWVPASVRVQSGYALDFDGVNDYIDCGLINESRTSLTITATIKTAMSGIGALVMRDDAFSATSERSWQFRVSSGKLQAILFDPSKTPTVATSTKSINDGTWRHLAATWDGSTIRLYIDGVSDGSAAFAGPIADSTETLKIGRSGHPNVSQSGSFSGSIADVRVYNRALNDAEIRTLYEIRPLGPYQFDSPNTVASVFGGAPSSVFPNDCTHTHTADSPTITQTHAIAPANASHGQSAASPTITQVHSIAPGAPQHGQTAGQPTITQAHQVAPGDATHGQSAVSPTITQVHRIAPAFGRHGHTATSPTITQVHAITPSKCTHGHTAGQPMIILPGSFRMPSVFGVMPSIGGLPAVRNLQRSLGG